MSLGLKIDLLRKRRQFFIDVVQAPLLWKITRLGAKYPVPTHENVQKANSHVYIDLFEEFERWNTAREPFIAAFKRVFICKYEADEWYAERIDWFVFKLHKLILGSKYLKPWVDCPTSHWNNPDDIKKVIQARLDLVVNSLLGGNKR